MCWAGTAAGDADNDAWVGGLDLRGMIASASVLPVPRQVEEMIDRNLHLRTEAQGAFELRHKYQVRPDTERLQRCSRVFARPDIVERLPAPW